MTDIVQTVRVISGHTDKKYQTVECEERKGSVETVENRGGHSDREKQTVQYEVLTEWTYCRRQQRTK